MPIGGWEIAIVVVVVLIIFGPKKLPELGSSLGKSIRSFKKGLKDEAEGAGATVAEVRETATAGVEEVKSAVSEARKGVGVDELKAAVKEVGGSANAKETASPGEEAAGSAETAAKTRSVE